MKTAVLRRVELQLRVNGSPRTEHALECCARPQLTTRAPNRVRNGPGRRASYAAYAADRNAKAKPRPLIRYESKPVPLSEGQKTARRAAREIQDAVEQKDLAAVIRAYDAFPSKDMISTIDRNHAIRVLRDFAYRLQDAPAQSALKASHDTAVEFARRLAADVRTGKVDHEPTKVEDLLIAFLLTGDFEHGVEFWSWWREHGESSPQGSVVYGAAISLLAHQGRPLAELEAVYGEALTRFPGDFAAYHLSHNAILADRSGSVTIKGVSQLLINGIVEARVLRGDSRGAYLGLDTAMRLIPVLNPFRLFSPYLRERPLLEAYTVLAIKYRSGFTFPVGTLRSVTRELRDASYATRGGLSQHMLTLRALLNLTYMHCGCTRESKIGKNFLSEILIFTANTMLLRPVARLGPDDRQQLARGVLSLIGKMLEVFARFGAMPGRAVFNHMMRDVVPHGRGRTELDAVLAAADASGVGRAEIDPQFILGTAGKLRDGSLVREQWESLIRARASAGEDIKLSDATRLARACALTDQPDYARSQLGTAVVSHFSGDEVEALEAAMAQHEGKTGHEINQQDLIVWAADCEAVPLEAFLQGLETITKDLDVVDELKGLNEVEDWSRRTLPISLLPPPVELQMPEADCRALYDRLTTEQKPDQPVTGSPAGEAPIGEASTGNPSTGEASSGEASSREASSGEASSGEVSTGEASTGEASTGEATTGEMSSGETSNVESPSPASSAQPASAADLPRQSPTNISYEQLRYDSWKAINLLLYMAEKHDGRAWPARWEAGVGGGALPQRTAGLMVEEGVMGLGLSNPEAEAVEDVGSAEHIAAAKRTILRLRGITDVEL